MSQNRFPALLQMQNFSALILFCKTSRLSLDPTLQGSRSDNVQRRNKRQQQLYGVVIQILTYARHAFSETGTTQRVK